MTDHQIHQLQFACNHCQTVLTVPVTMAGATGPCPCCREPLTAPSLQGPDAPAAAAAPADAAAGPALVTKRRPLLKSVSRRSLAFAGLGVALVGVAWSLKNFLPASAPLASQQTSAAAASSEAPADPKAVALTRSTAAVKKFLATSDWATARAMIATQDTPGTNADPAFQPARFQTLGSKGKFNPLAITPKENAGQYQIVWEIENPQDSEKLVMTADDTEDGVRIRWYQPPFFVATTQGTNTAPVQVAEAAPAPAPVAAPAPAPVPGTVTESPEAKILAATENAATLGSDGSAPLLNSARKEKGTSKGTATTKSPKAQPVKQ